MSYSARRSDRDIPILTTGVCIICGVIFLQLQSAQTDADYARWGLYSEPAIYEGKYWGLVTSAFVHIEALHLLFNLYWLYILGGAFERTFGAVRWILFVLSAAFVSSGIEMLAGASGIGLSGVGYALFGFGWAARSRYAEFAKIVDNQTVRLFVGWGLLCIVLTKVGTMNVANAAHFGGFLIGAAIGGIAAFPKARIPLILGTILLAAASVLPLFWSPLSSGWYEYKAMKAMDGKDYDSALIFLERCRQLDDSVPTRKFVYHNEAEIYGFKRDLPHYKEALNNLKVVDGDGAREVTDHYGDPADWGHVQD